MGKVEHVTEMGEFSYGVATQLSPLVRRVVCENPNPFTYLGTGTYIVGRGEVAVIDPGPPLASHVDDVLAALDEGETVTHILITHTHNDHSSLAGPLSQRTGAPTFGFGPHGEIPDSELDDKIDFSAHFSAEEVESFEAEWEAIPDELKREAPDGDFVPDRTLAHGDKLSGPGWTLTAVHTPGHCSNHLCYELAEESTLFTGDHVMGWATSVVALPDGSMNDYLDSLELLLGRGLERFVPTHGPPIEDPEAYTRSLIEHRRDREQQILDSLSPGPSTIAEIVPVLYAGYDKRLWYPAAASVLSHLEGLVASGTVAIDGDLGYSATYRLAGSS